MMAHPAPPSSANRARTSRRIPAWNPAGQWVWSAKPAHQALVSRQTFEAVQARRNDRASGTPRKGRSDARTYLLRGRLHCGLCRRRLQGQWVHQQAYYRCRYPAEYATAAGFDHPRSVYLREGDLLPAIEGWLARLTDPDHLQATCEAIAATRHGRTALDRDRAAARQVVADCDRRLGRYRAALEAGADPGVVGHWIAEVTAARQAAEVVLHNLAVPPPAVSPKQVRRAIQELGGLLMALDGSDPVLHAQPYQELGIEGTYDPHSRVVVVRADLGRPIERVGGGT
jgi:site-specific DNA recombinase